MFPFTENFTKYKITYSDGKQTVRQEGKAKEIIKVHQERLEGDSHFHYLDCGDEIYQNLS